MRYLLWDFDGTLGYREGGWSVACVDVLEESDVTPDVGRRDIRPHLQTGFPWHTPETPHTDISTAAEWWRALDPVFARAFEAIGVDPDRARALAPRVRQRYLGTSWRTFDDAEPALSALSTAGWRHIVLSNHVPELEAILEDLALTQWFEAVYTSATLGYEKPHPEAFRTVLESIDDDATVWMVGDSHRADIRGAWAVGLPAVLVRDTHPEVACACETLWTLEEILPPA